MAPEPLPVSWRLAEDPGLTRVVRQGVAAALPELAHSVHIELSGLEPERFYWYRFECGNAQSRVGRTRTAAAPGAPLGRLRFALASCQHYERGYFNSYRHMLDDDLDLVVHVGDYIYESAASDAGVRRHEGPEPLDVEAYRARHALYKTDPDLQNAHAAYPWVVTWDDHEVENDYAGDLSQNRDDPAVFFQRRVAAYRAYYEHMPLPREALVSNGAARLYRRLAFGDLLELSVLDGRQYRSDQPCGEQGSGGGQMLEDCDERWSASRTMLGPEQFAWLLEGLGSARARWNAIAQQTMMAPLDQKLGPGESHWSDGWDGYAAERRRLFDFIAERRTRDVVVMSGDIHSFWANELRAETDPDSSPALGAEIVATSITSPGIPYDRVSAILPDNPHVKFFESRQRGYVRCDLTPRRWLSDFQMVETVSEPESAARTLASFVVENGRPGIVPA
jgi:alkaline phosphatase D